MGKRKYIETPERLLEMWDEYKASLGNDTIEQASSRGDVVSLSVKKPLLRQILVCRHLLLTFEVPGELP
jgi:hypothetical protein